MLQNHKKKLKLHNQVVLNRPLTICYVKVFFISLTTNKMSGSVNLHSFRNHFRNGLRWTILTN